MDHYRTNQRERLVKTLTNIQALRKGRAERRGIVHLQRPHVTLAGLPPFPLDQREIEPFLAMIETIAKERIAAFDRRERAESLNSPPEAKRA